MNYNSIWSSGMSEGLGNIVANESYTDAASAWLLAEEGEIQQHEIFESSIEIEFNNIAVQHGLVTESTVTALNEANISNIFNRILAAITAFGEKIMGIIKNLLAKFQSLFIKDGKELVKKNKDAIMKKINTDKLSKMKWKSVTFTDPGYDVVTHLTDPSCPGGKFTQSITTVKDDIDSTTDIAADNQKAFTEEEITSMKNAFATKIVGSSAEFKTLKKDLEEKVFADEVDKEGFSKEDLTKISTILEGRKSIVDGLKKEEKTLKTQLDTFKKDLKATETKVNKLTSSSTDLPNLTKMVNVHIGRANQALTACTSTAGIALSALSDVYKKDYSRARSIFIKAVGYNGKDKDSVDEAAINDLNEYEINESFVVL